MSDIKTIKKNAETIYIHHPKSSYGIFCLNEDGDLFLNSDWGFYGYAWRSFGDNFKEFLAGCDAGYILGKFEINYIEVNNGKKIPKHRKENLTVLITELTTFLKSL